MIKELKQKGFDIKIILAIIFYIMLVCGIIGFLHETTYFLIKLHKFVKRGSTIGPWIPIYAFGAIINLLLLYKLKHNKFLVFILSAILSGGLEIIVGFLLDHFANKKLWGYEDELLNIGGYTCLKAVVFFGIGELLVMYLLTPFVIKLSTKINKNIFITISYILIALFLLDFTLSAF